jgi:hypothetical protein
VSERLRAIGRLGGRGDWFGYRFEADGPRLVFGNTQGVVRTPPAARRERRRDVATAAIAYFEELAASPPPELEATPVDLAEAVRWLVDIETDAPRRKRLVEAAEAIDDGLAGESVSGLLRDALGERRDSLELLTERYDAQR